MRVPDSLMALLDDGIVEEVVRPLMSGKEAQIYMVISEGEARVAKIYKASQDRNFKNRADYTEGRKVRNSRDSRAMAKRSRHGKAQDEAAWKSTEVDMIYRLRQADVRVPVPYHFIDGVLIMELVAGADGMPAPRLGEMTFTKLEAVAIFEFLLAEVQKMLCAGVVHGDLSDFNVLMAAAGPVIIDFPQSVHAANNRNARKLLLRDVENLHRFVQRFDPDWKHQPFAQELWHLYENGDLTAGTKLTGRYVAPTHMAATDEVFALIDDAREDAERDAERRAGQGASKPGRRPARGPRPEVRTEHRKPAVGGGQGPAQGYVAPAGTASSTARQGDFSAPQQPGRRGMTHSVSGAHAGRAKGHDRPVGPFPGEGRSAQADRGRFAGPTPVGGRGFQDGGVRHDGRGSAGGRSSRVGGVYPGGASTGAARGFPEGRGRLAGPSSDDSRNPRGSRGGSYGPTSGAGRSSPDGQGRRTGPPSDGRRSSQENWGHSADPTSVSGRGSQESWGRPAGPTSDGGRKFHESRGRPAGPTSDGGRSSHEGWGRPAGPTSDGGRSSHEGRRRPAGPTSGGGRTSHGVQGRGTGPTSDGGHGSHESRGRRPGPTSAGGRTSYESRERPAGRTSQGGRGSDGIGGAQKGRGRALEPGQKPQDGPSRTEERGAAADRSQPREWGPPRNKR